MSKEKLLINDIKSNNSEVMRNKQIEEMRKDLIEIFDEEYDNRRIITADFTAIKMTAKGYRKQIEGEWVAKTDYAGYGYYCSNCNAVFTGENAEWIAKEHHYCPKCGAHMRKEDDGK